MPIRSLPVWTPPEGSPRPLSFALNFDYRCPFSNILHDHVITGLRAGAAWHVQFLAFNLDQTNVTGENEGVWHQADRQPAMLAMRAAPAITTAEGVHRILMGAGLTTEQEAHSAHVGARAETLDIIRAEHELMSVAHDGFGTPTFLVDTIGENGPVTRTAFVRYVRPSGGDAEVAVRTVERIVDMVANWGHLNEFKHTTNNR